MKCENWLRTLTLNIKIRINRNVIQYCLQSSLLERNHKMPKLGHIEIYLFVEEHESDEKTAWTYTKKTNLTTFMLSVHFRLWSK